MKAWIVGATLMAALLQTPALAAELLDCKLDQNNYPGRAFDGFKLKDPVRYFMEVDGALKNGTEVTYERDEPVLNVDLKIVQTTPVLVPSAKVLLKSSWPLSPKFGYSKGAPIYIWQEAALSDGRQFAILHIRDAASVLFFDQSGEFCNKVLTMKKDAQLWQLGTLSKEPDDVVFERRLQDDAIRSGSLRIIYLGTSAGAMNFQEVWVQGSRIGKSIARTFDQFAKTIEIAGFTFQIVAAKGDKVTLRYDIASRTEISAGELNKIALQQDKR